MTRIGTDHRLPVTDCQLEHFRHTRAQVPLNVLNPLARVHHQPAGRVSGCHGQIAGAHALEKGLVLRLEAVGGPRGGAPLMNENEVPS